MSCDFQFYKLLDRVTIYLGMKNFILMTHELFWGFYDIWAYHQHVWLMVQKMMII